MEHRTHLLRLILDIHKAGFQNGLEGAHMALFLATANREALIREYGEDRAAELAKRQPQANI